MAKVGIFFGTGFEEVEALAVVDVLRRGGVEVNMISITGEETVTSSHGVGVKMDQMLADTKFDELDMIVLPGGMPGTRNLEACEALMEQVDRFYADGKWIGAICAAPTILGHRGILKGRNACCYPNMEDELSGAKVSFHSVEVSDKVITSRGMGTAIEFGLTILGQLEGEQKANQLAEKIVYKRL